MKKIENMPNNKNYHKNNIALIGHMGCGKSLIGKLIAKNLEFKHVDSDTLIEKETKIRIKEIFTQKGEIGFRKIEEEIILRLKQQNKLVLSLGGGSILSKKIRDFLKENFFTIFLDVDIKVLIERLKNNKKRPLLINVDIEKKIKQLDILRRKYYTQANIIVNNYGTTEEIVNSIIQKYKKISK